MSEKDPPPKRKRSNARRSEMLQRVTDDADVRSSARFLKIVFLRVVTATLAVCIIGAGAYVAALVIHQIYAALESHDVKLPEWAHESEILASGAVIVILLILALIIVAKDMWRVGVQGETSERSDAPPSDDNKHEDKN